LESNILFKPTPLIFRHPPSPIDKKTRLIRDLSRYKASIISKFLEAYEHDLYEIYANVRVRYLSQAF